MKKIIFLLVTLIVLSSTVFADDGFSVFFTGFKSAFASRNTSAISDMMSQDIKAGNGIRIKSGPADVIDWINNKNLWKEINQKLTAGFCKGKETGTYIAPKRYQALLDHYPQGAQSNPEQYLILIFRRLQGQWKCTDITYIMM